MTTTANTMGSLETKKPDCPLCRDTGYIIKDWVSAIVTECKCMEQKRLMKRFKSAMIPEEFQDATLEGYKVTNPAQEILFKATKKYLEEFDQIKNSSSNSLGFIAVFGEQRLKEIKDMNLRSQMKRKHNNFGLGKTHLQVALAKELIKRGETVLIISDVAIMDELMAAKQLKDKADFYDKVNKLINVPVLVWDDIGKSAPTEAKKSMYFHIINERYKAKRSIIYSSNEDPQTLEDRIGDAAVSRLFGMSLGRIYKVEGPDYRLIREAV